MSRETMIRSALLNIEMLHDMDFEDIVVSVKSSDVGDTVAIYRALAAVSDCPLHIGITEAGIGQRGIVKSAIGIGSLLLDGIGDTIRVSLTGDPVAEVEAAEDILSALGRLPAAINIISCPTCARCKADLAHIVEGVSRQVKVFERARVDKSRPSGVNRPPDVITVAIMGCAVNGPGEASGADMGVACGDGKAVFFKGGNIVRTIEEDAIIGVLLSEIKDLL
jgi:(E)-4-hydroxy-3-methylbut-2-enyl-diphosphate synthase